MRCVTRSRSRPCCRRSCNELGKAWMTTTSAWRWSRRLSVLRERGVSRKQPKRTVQLPAQPVPSTPVGELTLPIAELAVEYSTREAYRRWPSGRDEGQRREHRTTARGLLVQLAQAAGVWNSDPTWAGPRSSRSTRSPVSVTWFASHAAPPPAPLLSWTPANTGAIRYGEGGHTALGSRLPAAAVFVDEYVRLAVEIWTLRDRLARHVGYSVGPRRRPHRSPRRHSRAWP